MNRICLNPYSITVSESPSADRLSVLWILRRRSRLWRARNLHTQLRLIFRCRHSWIRWAGCLACSPVNLRAVTLASSHAIGSAQRNSRERATDKLTKSPPAWEKNLSLDQFIYKCVVSSQKNTSFVKHL